MRFDLFGLGRQNHLTISIIQAKKIKKIRGWERTTSDRKRYKDARNHLDIKIAGSIGFQLHSSSSIIIFALFQIRTENYKPQNNYKAL